jgi:aconitate hydratase
MIPFIIDGTPPFQLLDWIFIPDVRDLISGKNDSVEAQAIRCGDNSASSVGHFNLKAPELNDAERLLLLAGSLINYNRGGAGGR